MFGVVRRVGTAGGAARLRGSARRAAQRARRRSVAVFLVTACSVVGLLVLVAAEPVSPGAALLTVLFALLAGVVAAAMTERWTRSRFVDLRHHDLLEGLRPGGGATVVDLTMSEAAGPPHGPTGAGGSLGSHQLFGDCRCARCQDGPVPAAAEPQRRSSSSSTRQVIDLRSSAPRSSRVRLGQRPDQTA